MRLVRLYREAGSPREEARIHQLVERLNPSSPGCERREDGGKIYPSIGWSQKAGKLKALLADPEGYIQDIQKIAEKRVGKAVDFGRAFYDPNGVPIDTHMGKLTHTRVDPMKVEDRGSRSDLRDLIRDTKTPHLLARALGSQGDAALHTVLLDAQKKLINSKITYRAYKVAVAHAAHELGWEPRQVQECVWSAVVGIVAAKNLGVPQDTILQVLRHENAFQAWNVGALLSTPEITNDVAGLFKGPVAAFKAAVTKPPARTGSIDSGNSSAFGDVVARVPGSKNAGAWGPVEDSISSNTQAPF